MNKSFCITSHDDWTPKLIEQVYHEIEKIAVDEMELDIYPNSIEIITAEQMLDAYASAALPIHYNHWSFGKDFLKTQHNYQKGKKGLAFEVVINSSPCQSFLMEENSMVIQALVIAHAAMGHNAFFKSNECFKQWTDAGSIIDYMIFARDYIRICEERYGEEEVEMVLDAAHALAPHGVDKFKRRHPPKLTEEARLKKLLAAEDARQHDFNLIMQKTSFKGQDFTEVEEDQIEEEENLLYFIAKNSPVLEQWKREIIRIICKINQYYYPQQATQTSNEGFASFTHYYIMTRLEEKGFLSADAFMAFLDSHSAVIYQPEYDKPYFNGLNPYALGFAIYQDIKRICESPTNEDREWFPQLIGKRWQDAVKEAAFEHRDDGFIAQYLSPKVMRDFRMFSVSVEHPEKEDSMDDLTAFVSDIHDEVGYKNIRNALAKSKERINQIPQISVMSADLDGDRTLVLQYEPYMGRALDLKDAELVIEHIDALWGYAAEIHIN